MTLTGIDLSSWQAGIDLSAVSADFAIIKATGGVGYVNPACDAQFQSARAAGKRTGVYHFAHEVGCPGSAVAEADFFVDNIQGYLDGHTLLVLDFEGDNQMDSAYALAWLNRVQDRTGVKALVYLNGAALNGANWSAVWAADYGLWLAWYAVSTPTQGYNDYTGQPAVNATPPFPCAMWQFSSTAQLPGWSGNLDVNVFYGDGAAWDAYCRPSGTPAPAPVAPQSSPIQDPAPATVAATPGPGQCRVDPGDSLSAIGAQFGVNWQDIAALNGIGAPYTIYPGQILNLPSAAPTPAPAPAPSGLPPYCTVDPGDTLSGIAVQYGVSLDYIISKNPGINPDLIFPGQRINL